MGFIYIPGKSSSFRFKNEYSYLFDGVDERFNLSAINLNNFSISAWVKTTSTANYQGIVAWTVGTDRREIGIEITSGKALIVYGALKFKVATIVNSDGIWRNIVGTYDGTTPKVYINGSEDILGVESNAGAGVSDVFRIGDLASTLAYFFNGNIDEVGIFNADLTSGQITEIYNNGKPKDLLNHSASSNLVSYFRMGDGDTWNGTNWTAIDKKGTNNGTSNNMEEIDRELDVI